MHPSRRALLALLVLAATAGLSACIAGVASGTGPTAVPSSTAAPSPSPQPTAEPVAAAITVSAEAIGLLDESGATIASFDNFTPTAEVVAGLSSHLGAPVDSPYSGGLEMPPGTSHDWGGLRIVDTDAPVSPPYYGDHWVIVTTADANGLPLGTAPGVGSPAGVRVGDPFTSLTIRDETFVETLDSAGGRPIAYGRVGLTPLPPGGEYGDAPSLGVTVVGYTDDDTIDRFIAPARNWGP